MVQTKRQIIRDTDRFGGYGAESREADGSREQFTDRVPSDISSIKNTGANTVTVSDEPMLKAMPPIAAAPQEDKLYSTRQDVAAAPKVAPKPEVKRPVKANRPASREDIMPSIKTRAYVTEATEQAQAPKAEVSKQRRVRTNLDARTKVMLVVYVAVALVLAVAVIATGVSISKATASVQSMANEIAQKQTVIAAQEERIASVTNEATIRDEAIKNGMVANNGAAYSVDTVEKIDYPMPTPHTNGFDKFADAFGGFVS